MEVVEAFELDAVAFVLRLFLTLDSISETSLIRVLWLSNLKIGADTFKLGAIRSNLGYFVCQLDDSLVHENTDNVTVRAVEIVSKELLELNGFVKLCKVVSMYPHFYNF